MRGRLTEGADLDLGLAILAATQTPPHSSQVISYYCGCTRQRIQQIEARALRKMRFRLSEEPDLLEAFRIMATK